MTYERARFATDPAHSRGRRIQEPPSRTRTPFQRDRDRVIHSSAFRRLKQKTQVFVAHEGDHYRTRLTHSLEVAQIARTLARTLGLDEDLAECLALAHDLGHPPFGHTGEEALNEVMAPYGGFDHNAQSLRILTKLEERYPDFDGLNLSWETLEGLVKHNGPLITPGVTLDDLPRAFAEYCAEHDLELASFAGPEAQLAALADDIAYNNHDIDDGLKSGLFSLDDLTVVPLVADVLGSVRRAWPDIGEARQVAEMIRRLIGVWTEDLELETRRRVARYRPEAVSEVRALPEPIVAFSDAMNEEQRPLRAFLRQRMYRHWKVNRKRSMAKRVVRDLFGLYMSEPEVLPQTWMERAVPADPMRRARLVCDYIAGMTDGFAIEEHRKLLSVEAFD
jgi:dGTPase